MGKTKVKFLIGIFCGLLVVAEGYGFEWVNLYSSGAISSLSMSVMDPTDGGYAMVGEAGGIWVLKISPTGEVRWSESYGSPGDVGTSITMSCDGGLVVVGQTFSQGSGVGDVWLLRLDDRGQVLWQNTYGDGVNRYFPKSMRRTADCGFVVAGEVFSTITFLTRAWAMKLRRDGTMEWSYEYGGNCSESFNSISAVPDGYLAVGRSCSFRGLNYETGDAWVVKLSSTGSIVWQKTYGGLATYEEATSLAQAQDGFLVVGKTWLGDQTRSDGWAMKIDASGNILWQKIYGDSEFDELNFVTTIGNEYLLAGMTCPGASDGCNALLQRLDADGNIIWQNLYGGEATDGYVAATNIMPVTQTGDAGFLLVGSTLDKGFVARTDSYGRVFGCDDVASAILSARAVTLAPSTSTAVATTVSTTVFPSSAAPSPSTPTLTSVCEILERTTMEIVKTGSGTGSVVSTPPGIECGSDCSETFPMDTTVNLTATPSETSDFVGWGGDCAGCEKALTCTITMDGNKACVAQFADLKALTVVVSGSGTGVVSSSPSGIDCGADCREQYPDGTSIILTATPTSGHWFWGWEGDCSSCGTASSCSIAMESDKNCQALFVLPQRLSVTRSGIGIGTVTSNPPGIECGSDCTEEFPINSSVTLTATAAPSSIFNGWGRSCTGCGTNLQCVVTLDQAKVCDANFIAARGLTIIRSGTGAGTVTSTPPGINCGLDCQETFTDGTNVVLSATAGPGSSFWEWRGACAHCGSNPNCSMFAYTDRSCEAVFIDLKSLSVTKMGTGSGSITSSPPGIDCGTDCVGEYLPGTAVTLTATASTGSVFSGWTGACSGCGDLRNCSVIANEDKACGAVFSGIHTLTVLRRGTGVGMVMSTPGGISCGSDCTESYPHGYSVVLTAQPGAGSSFGGWGGDCVGNDLTCTLILDGNKTVEATFIDNPGAALVVTKSGPGEGLVKSKPSGIYCGSGCDFQSAVFRDQATVKLRAIPNSDSTFMGWTGACAPFGVSRTCTLIMDGDKEVGANFGR